MSRRRQMAAALGLSGTVSWAGIVAAAAAQRGELTRATRDVREMQVFLSQVQMVGYEQGAADIIADVQAAACILPDVDVIYHVRRLAQLWAKVHGEAPPPDPV